MQTKPEHLYEYAVIRMVPKVEREEFFNIGLIMMCKRQKWLKVAIHICDLKMSSFPCAIAREELCRQLDSFIKIANGEKNHGPIAMLPVEERFRWLTAVRSTCLQTSRPHPGMTDDLESTFHHLFSDLVE